MYSITDNNRLAIFICGEECFADIADQINKAKKSVELCCSNFDPGMELVRGDNCVWPRGETFGDLLIAAAYRGVAVNLVVSPDSLHCTYDAQMVLAGAYAAARRFDDEEIMTQCAFRQGHGAAALALGVDRRAIKMDFKEAIQYFQEGVKFGNKACADALLLLFEEGYWINTKNEGKGALKALGITVDTERASRYGTIAQVLEINPDLKLSRLNLVLPLPPSTLPNWSGVDDALEPESYGQPIY